MSANAELGWKVFDRIEQTVRLEAETGVELAEGWDQRSWGVQSECHTAYCYAGWTCLLEGDRPVFEPARADRPGQDPNCDYALAVRTAEGDVVPIQTRAGQLLGLSLSELSGLFSPFVRSLELLEQRVRECFGPRPEESPGS